MGSELPFSQTKVPLKKIIFTWNQNCQTNLSVSFWGLKKISWSQFTLCFTFGKKLISRNFCQKIKRVKLRYKMSGSDVSQCGNLMIFLSWFLGKNFVKLTFATKFTFHITVGKSWKFTITEKYSVKSILWWLF